MFFPPKTESLFWYLFITQGIVSVLFIKSLSQGWLRRVIAKRSRKLAMFFPRQHICGLTYNIIDCRRAHSRCCWADFLPRFISHHALCSLSVEGQKRSGDSTRRCPDQINRAAMNILPEPLNKLTSSSNSLFFIAHCVTIYTRKKCTHTNTLESGW
jgi:hypothetical protein